jgi:hypothetical protein
MGDDGQALCGEEDLHHRLVHADGRSEDAATDVRDVRQLQEPLDGAVFAVRSVQDREDDIQTCR